MEFKDYIAILNRRKWLIIVTLLAALVTVFVGSKIQTPIYESSVTLRVAASSVGQLNYSSTTYATQLLNTTAQIATSQPVLAELAKRLELSEEPVVKSEVIPNTELIKLTVENTDPKMAAQEATALAEIIISQSNFVYTGGATSSLNVLGTQVAKVEQDILTTRGQYAASLLVTPPAPEASDLLYQELMLQQRNYDSLLSQYQSAQVLNEMRAHMITVVDSALVPDSPSKPNLLFNLIIGAAAGLLAGIILAFIFDSLDDTLYSTQEIERFSGIPVFSRIPKTKKSYLALSANNNSAFSDSFRELALRVQQMSRKKPIKVILVFSAEPNQGKSMVVSHLAVALSESGKKVVAVDCDLRMPRLHQWFQIQNSTGLKDVIDHQADIISALKMTSFENCWVLTSGKTTNKPMLVLGSNRMHEVINLLSGKFDYVLLDTPALLAVGDASVISEYADALILVARRKESTKEAVKAAGNFLKNYTNKFTALVVNQDETRDGYYYHHSAPVDEPLSSEYLLNRLQGQEPQRGDEVNGTKRKKRKMEIDPNIESVVLEIAKEQPSLGQIKVANELRKEDFKITPAQVRNIWLKHGLETAEKRSQASQSNGGGSVNEFPK